MYHVNKYRINCKPMQDKQSFLAAINLNLIIAHHIS